MPRREGGTENAIAQIVLLTAEKILLERGAVFSLGFVTPHPGR
jgi:hypothetical protein